MPILIAQKTNIGFQRLSNSSEIMKNINTDGLEYAACISADGLEFYFTRLKLPISASSSPEIFISKRANTNSAFETPEKIESITGFAEAPTISSDNKILYFHKKENSKFVLYFVKKNE